MSYKIIMDSCGELPEELSRDPRFERVAMELKVGEHRILDDDNFDQADFIKKLAECKSNIGSSCASPEAFMEACRTDADRVYIITISSHLSGSYNSAVLAAELYHETYGEKDIFVVDSESASGGETQLAMKIMACEDQGLDYETIKKLVSEYRDEMHTYFVLDNLENLRKSGRLSTVKALVANTLNIKPVMGEDHGVIIQKGQTVGFKKALGRLVELVKQETTDIEHKPAIITHVNTRERAEHLEKLLKKAGVPSVTIMDTAGLSTLYACDGGIIVAI